MGEKSPQNLIFWGKAQPRGLRARGTGAPGRVSPGIGGLVGDPAPLTRPLSLPAGDRYIVADCGGGTVDLTVHQIEKPQGTLKELYKASGGLQPPASHHPARDTPSPRRGPPPCPLPVPRGAVAGAVAPPGVRRERGGGSDGLGVGGDKGTGVLAGWFKWNMGAGVGVTEKQGYMWEGGVEGEGTEPPQHHPGTPEKVPSGPLLSPQPHCLPSPCSWGTPPLPVQDPSLAQPWVGGSPPHPPTAERPQWGWGLAQRVPQALLGDAKGVRGHVGRGDVG